MRGQRSLRHAWHTIPCAEAVKKSTEKYINLMKIKKKPEMQSKHKLKNKNVQGTSNGTHKGSMMIYSIIQNFCMHKLSIPEHLVQAILIKT